MFNTYRYIDSNVCIQVMHKVKLVIKHKRWVEHVLAKMLIEKSATVVHHCKWSKHLHSSPFPSLQSTVHPSFYPSLPPTHLSILLTPNPSLKYLSFHLPIYSIPYTPLHPVQSLPLSVISPASASPYGPITISKRDSSGPWLRAALPRNTIRFLNKDPHEHSLGDRRRLSGCTLKNPVLESLVWSRGIHREGCSTQVWSQSRPGLESSSPLFWTCLRLLPLLTWTCLGLDH